MPLYEYLCTSCGYRFEKIQKISEAPEAACPKCGGELVRPLTAPALQFKGAGWYVNDYASKPASNSGSENSTSESKTESKPAESKPSTESKPSSTSETTSKPASSSGTSSNS